MIREFTEAVRSIQVLRKNGHLEARYPFRILEFRDIPYTNQAARINKGYLFLPNGNAGRNKIKLRFNLPGRLMEARLCKDRVILVCEVPNLKYEGVIPIIGVDLGVNTLISATDGVKTLNISGRELKSLVQYRNKKLAGLQAKQSSKIKHSSRWDKLQKRKAIFLTRVSNKIKDILHKSTRLVADEFPNAKAFVGKPFNSAAQRMGRIQAQQVSSASNARLIHQLDYKLSGAIQINEAYTSQTCPVCGVRNKCGRIYKCKSCGLTKPRDFVGSLNIRSKGISGSFQQIELDQIPSVIKWVHPIKYPKSNLGSSGVSPASSSGFPRSLPERLGHHPFNVSKSRVYHGILRFSEFVGKTNSGGK